MVVVNSSNVNRLIPPLTMFQKILIIDDDPFTVTLFEKVSTVAQFAQEVTTCLSAVDGLDYLSGLEARAEAAPEVIFLDIGMPIVSGWQFLEHLKTFSPSLLSQTKIYMLTASTNQSDIIRAKKFGIIEDYIVKPITVKRLQAIRADTAVPIVAARHARPGLITPPQV